MKKKDAHLIYGRLFMYIKCKKERPLRFIKMTGGCSLTVRCFSTLIQLGGYRLLKTLDVDAFHENI